MNPECDNCKRSYLYKVDGVEYTREIMVEVQGVYDGGLYFQCPWCGTRSHRWSKGTRQWKAAERYVNADSIPRST